MLNRELDQREAPPPKPLVVPQRQTWHEWKPGIAEQLTGWMAAGG